MEKVLQHCACMREKGRKGERGRGRARGERREEKDVGERGGRAEGLLKLFKLLKWPNAAGTKNVMARAAMRAKSKGADC